jgi:hypothetical protein
MKEAKFDTIVRPLECPVCHQEFISSTEYSLHTSEHLCGYSNCFRPFYRMRGFMPTCKRHYEHPQKWGKDGLTYTGSVWHKASNSQEEKVEEL